MITIETYMMGRDTLYPDEYKSEYRANARALLEKVNALLAELGINNERMTSGYRPPSVNRKYSRARLSHHTTGNAVDIADPNRSLARTLLRNPKFLEQHALYLEDPAYSKGWIHLQDIAPKSGRRIFIPH